MSSTGQIIHSHDLYAVERWVGHMADGTVVPLDPATGDRLVGTHQWIEAEPHLTQGAEHLGNLGARVSVLIDGVVHKGDDSFPDDFESIVAAHPFGFEALPWNRSDHEEELAELRSVGRKPHFLDDIWPPDPYETRVMDAAAASSRPSFGIDPGTDGTAVERLMLDLIWAARNKPHQPAATLDFTPSQRHELHYAFQVMRHEYWPRKLGYEAMLAGIGPGDSAYLLMGAMHGPLFAAQLEALYGLQVCGRSIASPLLSQEVIRNHTEMYGLAIARRRITPEELEASHQEVPSFAG